MTRDFTVGILFLAALVLLGSLTFMEKGAPWGAREYEYTVYFDNVAGLVRGQEVRVRGVSSITSSTT